MNIYAIHDRWGTPTAIRYPAMILRADSWDDFGYKTMYQAEYHAGKDEVAFIGALKVMKKGQETSSTVTKLPRAPVTLDDSYCSLGQAASYYENLLDILPKPKALAYLEMIQDLAAHPERIAEFESDPCYTTSLLRESGARRALEDGADIILGNHLDTRLEFSFNTAVGGNSFDARFSFGDTPEIPSRINAIIGYNGTGKTQLLVNLSHVACGDDQHRAEVSSQYGQIHPENIAFGRVVAISYSAFDTFKTPTAAAAKRAYRYCGLRDLIKPSRTDLKGQDTIAQEIEDSVSRLNTEGRWESLESALEPLFREPSFRLSIASLDFRKDPSVWRPQFDTLSTGHKISINIVVQLVSQLENKSLVLLDEPESHLHPPLLAALMKGITVALEETNSFAVVATHSPVVLQEVAKRHVQVVRRSGHITTVEKPSLETFGENIGVLTRTIFNLDNADADYEGVLSRLAKTHGAQRVHEVFPDGLSSQALGILLQHSSLPDPDYRA